MPDDIIEKVNNPDDFYKSTTKIDIYLIKRSVSKDELEGPYGSIISYLEDNKEVLWIETPMDKGYPLILAQGDLVLVDVKKGKTIYQFQSAVLGRKKDSNTNLFLFALNVPKEVKKIERRVFFRLKITDLDVVLKIKKNINDKDFISFKGNAHDLSGGGIKVRLILKDKKPNDYEKILTLIKEEAITFIEFEIDKKKKINQKIKFVSSYKDEENKIGYISFSFVEIPRGIQDSIIRYIFNKQREMKQKGIEFDD